MTQKRMRRTAQIMLMWFHITWHFTRQEWKRKQKDKDWVTVERFRSVQGLFIQHLQSVSKPILLFSMQGNMLCLCWWFFSFRLLSQSIKAVPFWPDTPVTGDVFHFSESFWNKNPIAASPLASLSSACVMSRCLLGRCARSWLRTWPGFKSRNTGFFMGFFQRESSLRGTCQTTKTKTLNSVFTVTTLPVNVSPRRETRRPTSSSLKKLSNSFKKTLF